MSGEYTNKDIATSESAAPLRTSINDQFLMSHEFKSTGNAVYSEAEVPTK